MEELSGALLRIATGAPPRSTGDSSDIFTPQALRAIASFSSGNPRVISRVCDLALMIANKIDKSNIDEEVANLAINEINM